MNHCTDCLPVISNLHVFYGQTYKLQTAVGLCSLATTEPKTLTVGGQ